MLDTKQTCECGFYDWQGDDPYVTRGGWVACSVDLSGTAAARGVGGLTR